MARNTVYFPPLDLSEYNTGGRFGGNGPVGGSGHVPVGGLGGKGSGKHLVRFSMIEMKHQKCWRYYVKKKKKFDVFLFSIFVHQKIFFNENRERE